MNVLAGSTNVSVYFYIMQDAGSGAPGEPVTGLLFSDIETGGSASYLRTGMARTDFTLVTLASADAAHTDGGFILIDDTNMPGLYRCDVPDAAFASGVDHAIIQLKVSSGKDAVVPPLLIDLGDAGASLTNLGGMSTGMKAEVLAEINTSIDTAISELSQAQPTATPTLRTGLMLLYMALRNQLNVSTSGSPDVMAIYNNAGTVVAKKQLTDVGGDYSEAKMETGP